MSKPKRTSLDGLHCRADQEKNIARFSVYVTGQALPLSFVVCSGQQPLFRDVPIDHITDGKKPPI